MINPVDYNLIMKPLVMEYSTKYFHQHRLESIFEKIQELETKQLFYIVKRFFENNHKPSIKDFAVAAKAFNSKGPAQCDYCHNYGWVKTERETDKSLHDFYCPKKCLWQKKMCIRIGKVEYPMPFYNQEYTRQGYSLVDARDFTEGNKRNDPRL